MIKGIFPLDFSNCKNWFSSSFNTGSVIRRSKLFLILGILVTSFSIFHYHFIIITIVVITIIVNINNYFFYNICFRNFPIVKVFYGNLKFKPKSEIESCFRYGRLHVFIQEVVLNDFEKFTLKLPFRGIFFIKLPTCSLNFFKKDLQLKLFSCTFSEMFHNSWIYQNMPQACNFT